MSTVTAAAIATGATAIVKKVLDDLYSKAKEAGVNYLGRSRSDVKEAAIARALNNVTKVKTLWNVDKEVSLHEFYYPSSVVFADGPRKQISSLKELGTRQNFVIQGTAGQGKSIFLRYLCGQELHGSSASGRVPVFVELRRLRSDFGVQELILESLKKYKLPHTAAAWEFLAGTGKFVLLLDAFDEVDPSLAARAVADLEALTELFPDSLQIVITSRPDAEIQHSARFRVCRLAPLRSEDHLPFLKKICPEKGQAESLAKVLQSSSTEIRLLVTTPLMMTLFVILYKSLQTVPDTVPKFYEELFDVLFYRHDHSKPGFRRKRHTTLDDSKIKKLFSAFCFYVRLDGLGVLSKTQLSAAVERACKATNEQVDAEKFKDELIKTVCLMQQDGFEYSFIHKSVTQYYAAAFVRGSSDNFADKFYALATKPSQDWELELRFLEQIDTYRYTKFHFMPRLNEIAQMMGCLSSNVHEVSKHQINRFLVEQIDVVFRKMADKADEKYASSAGFAVFWSRRGRRDLLMIDIARPWVARVLKLIREDAELEASVLSAVKDDPYTHVSLKSHLKEIERKIPDLGEEVRAVLQSRRDAALKVLQAEDEKTAMIAALL